MLYEKICDSEVLILYFFIYIKNKKMLQYIIINLF